MRKLALVCVRHQQGGGGYSEQAELCTFVADTCGRGGTVGLHFDLGAAHLVQCTSRDVTMLKHMHRYLIYESILNRRNTLLATL